MSFAEGLSWDAPFLDSITCSDKSNQIDKVQELNSLTCRSSKTTTQKISEIRYINKESYTYSFTNVIFNIHQVVGFKSLTITSAVKSYLHLLQLY